MIFTRTARVFTTAGDGVLLFMSMTGTEALGRPFEYDLELLADHEQMDLVDLLGQPMSIQLEMVDGGVREFNGLVTSFSLAGEVGRRVRYLATLRPWLWMLTRTTNCRIFQNQTVPDIIKAIFREHQFSDFEERLTETYRTWEYLVQYRESDFNFVSRMMEQEGIYYFFKHSKGKHTLVLSDSYSAHEGVPGYTEVPYFPPHKTERRERDHVDSWRARRQFTSGAFATTDYDFERPNANLYSPAANPEGYNRSNYELFDYPGEIRDASEGDVQAKLRLQEEQVDHDVVLGGGNARGIQVGALFSLTDFPREDQNKEYLVLAASHELRIDDYESIGTGEESPIYRVRFKAAESKRAFRVPRFTRKPVVNGPQTAVVVGQSGQEIWTDEYARVKVQFHWDREGKRDENSSCWVRVAQVWAGSGWGGIHIPRMGQEVIVDFLEGDPDRPLVTGRLYNADNMPPYALPQNQTQSGIKSHSTKGGGQDNFNEIRFEDKKGEEELHLQAEKNMTTLVKNDQSTTVQANRSAGVTGNDSVSVGGDRSLSVTGNLSISVQGGGSGSPQSNHSVTGSHSLSASDKVDITAPNKITLTCGGSSITMTPTRIVIHAGDGTELAMDANGRFESSGKSKIFLDANADMESSGGSKILLDGNACMTSSAGSQLLLDGNAALNTSGNATIDGAVVACTGQSEANISAGGSLKLTPASAELSGAQVNVAGQGVVSIGGPLVKIG